MAIAASPSFYVTWSFRTGKPARKGEASGEADAWASTLGQFVVGELDGKYPCVVATTQSDVSAMLDNERRRQSQQPVRLLDRPGLPRFKITVQGSLTRAPHSKR